MHTDLVGKLLVASHHLLDPNFYRTVVLIMLHEPENGAMGLILNRETDQRVESYLPGWKSRIAPPGLVHYGGPVEPDIAVGLGPAATGIGSIGPGLAPVDLAADPGVDGPSIRVYSGYAGWDVGQLEAELAEGAWHVVNAETNDPFVEPKTLWQRVLQRQTGNLAIYSTFPEDPNHN